jgi:site-specific recombinase XerD
MGHSTVKVTEGYTHLANEALKNFVKLRLLK